MNQPKLQKLVDPFAEHPPCFTEFSHLIMAALGKSHSQMERNAQARGVPASNSYHTRREAGASEVRNQANAKQPKHYYIFCTHEIPYWRCCTKCGRDKALAKRNVEMFFNNHEFLSK